MNDDFEVDSIYENDGKKKPIKSGRKGKRVENELCKYLNKRFSKLLSKNTDWGSFSRSVGSGNRWGQVTNLPKHARETYSSDITCPENFRYTIESKGGYNDIDLCSAFDGGHKELDGFLQQAVDDGKRSGRKPLLIWKKDRKPRLAFIRSDDIDYDDLLSTTSMATCLTYWAEWYCLNLDVLLELPDSFFFDIS